MIDAALIRLRKRRRRPPRTYLEDAWLSPPVPDGFWYDIRNRRRYLKWLGQRLGFVHREDWYHISTSAIQKNLGGGAMLHWNHSAVGAVKELFPDGEWYEWLFDATSRGFWKDRRNHRRYLEWLGQQLGIKRFEDWYHVTNKDFAAHAGGSFLLEYRSTISQALMKCFPEHDWKEWLFDQCPSGFWRSVANRRRYMRWLGQRLGYTRPTDWYNLSVELLQAHEGRVLMRAHHCSVIAAVREFLPRRTWHEWLFPRTSQAFWKKKENRREFLDWLGQQLKLKSPEDWLQVRTSQIKKYGAGALLAEFGALAERLAECLPQLDFRKKRVVRPLAREQILAWADAHFRRTGKWPTKGSGRIPGTRETWYKIDTALSFGFRGHPGGTKLTDLLAAERGVRHRNKPPALNQTTIRSWIETWHARTGEWPNCRSGAIPESGGETWAAVANAFTRGNRGLAPGLTLERFVVGVRGEQVGI